MSTCYKTIEERKIDGIIDVVLTLHYNRFHMTSLLTFNPQKGSFGPHTIQGEFQKEQEKFVLGKKKSLTDLTPLHCSYPVLT